eukprot:CAMPEP_0185727372 /NCGR_PEP_ID=MMETSP1171-20130828/3073_1 /TAXON_ID=374046 /ORGANISM="Helicotheca tamensis, Strain CCMP826" /LENGTH=121 /DNA_ID=CAMNT_0028395919 /DNA_START=117 /DNA_END=482 /DNA_ORIENTATION=+
MTQGILRPPLRSGQFSCDTPSRATVTVTTTTASPRTTIPSTFFNLLFANVSVEEVTLPLLSSPGDTGVEEGGFAGVQRECDPMQARKNELNQPDWVPVIEICGERKRLGNLGKPVQRKVSQ